MSRPLLRIVLSSLVLAAGSSSLAHADVDPEVELVSGAAVPLGGDDYADALGQGYMLGLRGVGYKPLAEGLRVGAELALDGLQQRWHSATDLYRVRGLIGGRLEYRPLSFATVFVRGLAGFDRYSASIAYAPPEPGRLDTLHQSRSALALELGVGARATFGRWAVGVQVGLPMAFYSPPALDEDDRGSVLHGGVEHPISEPPAAFAFIHSTVVDVNGVLSASLAF
jgi:hypothetical protein